MKRVLHIGIMSRKEYMARTIAIAKGEYVPKANEPKIWFESTKSMAEVLSNDNSLLTRILNEVNVTLKGWVGYFHYRNCAKALAGVQRHAEERLRIHLRKRHKIKNRGTGLLRFNGKVPCISSMDCTRCRRQQAGRKRMPYGEEHRKAVCGRTACTV